MPTAKVKGGSSYHRYRPASEYDDATLAQKREYWRNKKREQRARVSEHRGKPALESSGKKPSLINTQGDCAVQCFFDAPPIRNRNEVEDSSPETTESQMGKWSNSKNLNMELSQLPASFSITTKAAGVDTVTATPPYTGTRTIYSATSSETQLLSRSSVPPVRLNMVNNGSSIKTKPYSMSMQDTSLPKTPNMAQTAYSTGSIFVSPSREHKKTEVGASNPTPQCGKRSALVSTQTCPTLSKMSVSSVRRIVEPQRKVLYYGTGGIVRCKTPRQRFIDAQKNVMHQINLKFKSPMLSSKGMPKIDPAATPEQVIAKRREYWRDKKREQRAKLSMDKKVRLKEKDSLMRRVKRYQKILEDMRKARTLMHTTGEALTHSDTIGGFIEEDGTLTMNVLRNPTGHTGQKVSKIQSHCKHKDTPFIRIPRPSPPLQPVQVRVSVPLAGHFTKKSQMLTSIKSQAESIRAPTAHTHTGVQLRLSHPQASQNTLSGGSQAASNLRGCVMKMAVSSRAPSLSALTLHPELTEEERMARRREYWRIKKREQRAARAVRLKQGLIQVRAMAALEKRKAQKRISSTEPTEIAQTLPERTKLPNVNVIKMERDCLPTTDPSTLTEQTTCSDTKPPPIPLLASPPELDPAQSSESQSATLLAVASMRKLLEESLSTVSEHRSEQWDIKTETPDEYEALEQDIKPDLALFVKEEVAPVSADLTLLPVDTDVSEQVDFPCSQIKNSPSPCETPPPLHHSAKVEQHPTCEKSSHSPSHIMVTPSLEASDSSSSPPEAHRLQSFRSPGSLSPPQLTGTNHSQPQQQPLTAELLCKSPEASQDNRSPTIQECELSALSGLSSLQRKREYWKLMKRQQRARLRAQQRDRQVESSYKLPHRDIQVPGLVTIKPKPPVAPLAAMSSMPSLPTLLVVRHTQDGQQLPGTVRVKPPASILERNPMEALQSSTGPPEPPRLSHSWTHGAADIDAVPSLPTLKPPENPLSSINLQPIEPCHSPDTFVSPMSSHPQSNTNPVQSPTKLVPISNMVPPKPIRGESKEDFMKRKREYWRIKKKEQRARKAVLHKRPFPTKKVSSSYETVLSEQHLLTQDSKWVNSEKSEHLISVPMESDPGSFPYSVYTLEGESELLLTDFANTNGEDAALSDAMWRNRFLMDYDPLNQLLVCMVCGELQYSHSLDGVRTHIDEAHPHTLTLETEERERMMKSWDEQVSQRERFFTSQLQQHSSAVTEAHLS